MAQPIRIRNVTVELLRSGPSHNQLLSPLTLYLGICDEAEAGLVSLPFEHHRFLRRMAVLRYDAAAKDADKLPELREMGVEMAKVLGSIPRLPGALAADDGGRDTLVHLRLVLTAAELALLPFELAKMPLGPMQCAESWLALQSRVPVVVTRRTRNVVARDFQWLKKPRILFVAANPDPRAPDNVPFAEHRSALIAAVRPFLLPDDRQSEVSLKGRREQFGRHLTILSQPSIDELVAECRRNRYTHIHVLAHGDTDASMGDHSFGLRLHPRDGVISGERLASAITCMAEGQFHRPDVVTLATCDSGNSAESVLAPGASIAHVLHQAGVPLVLASQFPLSKNGSVLVAREFYSGLLWGEHPWVLMHRVRMALHGTLGAGDHDWASLVVYEALELDTYKLDEARFNQCEQAMQAAWLDDDGFEDELEGDDDTAGARGLVAGDWKASVVIDRLPVESKYFGMRALALRADGRLQNAIDCLNMPDTRRARSDADGEYAARVADSCRWMEDAIDDYEAAVEGFLVRDGQGMNAPYRALVALLRLRAVLGRPSEPGTWETALFWVEATLRALPDDDEERAWALACLCELHLLRLLDPDDAVRRLGEARAQYVAGELVRLDRLGTSLPRHWLLVQLEACVMFWGDPRFEAVLHEFGELERRSFLEGTPNLVGVATAVWEILDKPAARERARQLPAPPPPKGTAKAPKAKAQTTKTARKSEKLGAPAPAAASGFITLDMLPARHGDALWLEYGPGGDAPPARVLIDCGPVGTYPELRARIESLPAAQRHFELFILSHIDDDHIGAAIKLLNEARALGVSFGDVWFNGWRHLSDRLNAAQGEAFSALLEAGGLPWNLATDGKAMLREVDTLPVFTLPGGLRLTLLSPTPERLKALARAWKREVGEAAGTPAAAGRYLGRVPSSSEDVEQLAATPFESDTTAPNGSSIAVLAEYGGHTLLLGADAYAPVLQQAVEMLCRERGVERLPLDAFKLPHHGSQNNLSNELLQRLQCSDFLVSTNGPRFNHPDREAIARVVQQGRLTQRPARLWFNYRTPAPLNAVWDKPELKARYGYATVYPDAGKEGLRFILPRP